MPMPLRYRISSWRQLPGVKSNNSKKLSISVTDFIQSDRLGGFRIAINHKDFGTLFAYIIDATGRLVTNYPDISCNFTTATILTELARFGFLVDYNPVKAMDGTQIQFLMTLQGLFFDKIRVLSVWDASSGEKQFKTHVVAFKTDPLGDWLNSAYCPSIKEYTDAVINGYAFDISAATAAKEMDWSWLVGWIGDINLILRDNAEALICQST